MKLSISAASYVGSVRHNNEDMVLVGSRFIRNDQYWTMADTADSDRYLVALADGMGGHSSGEVASSDTLHNLQFYYGDLPSNLSVEDFNEAIFEWLESMNHIIDSKGRVNDIYKGMGTTLVGLACYENRVYSLNCGDSRLYRQRNGVLTQMTTDHSLEKETGMRKHASIVTNCIGGGCNSSFFDMEEFAADILHGDVYLLCSDGLTDMLNDQEIETLLNLNADANALCEAAIKAGGLDNVSACVINVE